jgi:hypothetical protein
MQILANLGVEILPRQHVGRPHRQRQHIGQRQQLLDGEGAPARIGFVEFARAHGKPPSVGSSPG